MPPHPPPLLLAMEQPLPSPSAARCVMHGACSLCSCVCAGRQSAMQCTLPAFRLPDFIHTYLLTQYVSDATCGDYNGATGSTAPFTDAMCGLAKVYDTTKAATSIAGNSESAAVTACCKVGKDTP